MSVSQQVLDLPQGIPLFLLLCDVSVHPLPGRCACRVVPMEERVCFALQLSEGRGIIMESLRYRIALL